MPHRPLLRGFGGQCDGGPLACTRIDPLALHAGADSTVLPSTSLRSLGFVASYGFSIGLLQHVEGGIFSSTAVWGQPSPTASKQTDTLWQQGPLRFALKGLVWPFTKNPHQGFAVLADFEYEARLPHFAGQNQLGFLTDLAALRAVGNLPLGLAEVGVSVGALWDGAGTYATPELGARAALHLPFMTDTKIFAEGVARGVGAWLKSREPTPDSLAPAKPIIVPSGALAFGLVTRPRRQIAFAMVVHVGFGDVAPFFLTVRGPLDFALGDGYPYPQSLVADILRQAAAWIAEQNRKLPEPLQQTCLLYGRDGQPLAAMGSLTADGEHCAFHGQRFHIGDTLYPDPGHRRICLEPEAMHCVGAPSSPNQESEADPSPYPGAEPAQGDALPAGHLDPAVLERLLNQGALGPIRGELDNRCILNEGEHQVSPIGHLSPDGKHCDIERAVNDKRTGKKLGTQVVQVPIGQPVYRDPATGRVCLTRKTKSNKDCPVALDSDQNRPLSSGAEVGYHGAIGLVDWTQAKANQAKGAAHLLTHPAELTTAARKATARAEQAAKTAVETLKDPNQAQQAAHEAWASSIDAAHGAWEGAATWYKLPTQKKLDGLTEGAVKGGLDLGAAAVLGGVGKAGVGLEATAAAEATEGAKVVQTGRTLATKVEAERVAEAEAQRAAEAKVIERGSGRGANHLKPNPSAQGPHSTFKVDAEERITGYAEWQPNPRNPTGMDQVKRVDTQHANPHTHHDNVTGQPVPTPHVHEKTSPGSVRPARPDELPR